MKGGSQEVKFFGFPRKDAIWAKEKDSAIHILILTEFPDYQNNRLLY